MFNIGKNAISDSTSLTKAIFDNYYPNDKLVIENTSFAKEGVQNRTLNSRTVSDAIAGDALFRSPKYNATFMSMTINSRIESTIVGGLESVYDGRAKITIEDPESISVDEDKKPTTIQGGAAFTRIMADGILGKQVASNMVDRFMKRLTSDLATKSSSGGHGNGDGSGSGDTASITTSGRMVALDSLMSDSEKQWILERGKVLADTGFVQDSSFLKNGFSFDITNGLTGMTTKDPGSEYPGIDLAAATNISEQLINASSQKAYIAPTLIEFLILLSSKIKFSVGLAPSRFTDDPVKNVMQSNTSLSAHGFGRAVDFSTVTSKDGQLYDMWNNAGNLDIYRKAMDVLLSAINSMPMHLIPDLIGFAGPLADEYGAKDGPDGPDISIKKKYPNLKYINFYGADDHLNHCHISFSAPRSGIYTGPGGTLGVQIDTSSGGTSGAPEGMVYIPGIGTFPIGGSSNPKFKQNFKIKNSGQLINTEIFDLLLNVAVPELAALMTAISQREGNVGSWTPSIKSTGDFSFGFLQVNLLAHGNKRYLCPYPKPELLDGWKLAQPNWQSLGYDNFTEYITALKDLANSMSASEFSDKTRNESDERLWYPINQAFIVYKIATGREATYPLPLASRMGNMPSDVQYVLGPWGDYSASIKPGPLASVKYSDAKAVYVDHFGGKEDTLKKWIRDYFSVPGNGATSNASINGFVEPWLTGKVFNRQGVEV